VDGVLEYGRELQALTVAMAPWLLLGFALAGVLHALLPAALVSRHLGAAGLRGPLLATLLGTPMPLCSCSVMPVATMLRAAGATPAAVLAFLITTPVTGVDSALATWGTLGPGVTVARIAASVCMGLLAASLLLLAVPGSGVPAPAAARPAPRGSMRTRLRAAAAYGFGELPASMAGSLVLGLLLAALVSVALPADRVADLAASGGLLVYVAMVLLGAPLYVCATGSIPLAMALVAKGISPGAATTFLIAGPATNLVTMTVVRTLAGRGGLPIYLATIFVGAVGTGLVVDALALRGIPMLPPGGSCHAVEAAGLPELLAALLLVGLLLVPLARRGLRALRPPPPPRAFDGGRLFSVPGMTCSGCQGRVRDALAAAGAGSVTVDLAQRTVRLPEGCLLAPEQVREVLASAGYEAHPANDPRTGSR